MTHLRNKSRIAAIILCSCIATSCRNKNNQESDSKNIIINLLQVNLLSLVDFNNIFQFFGLNAKGRTKFTNKFYY